MKKLLPLLAGVALLSACKKENPVTNTMLLTAKNWHITAETTTVTGNGQTVVTDELASRPACEIDNFSKFNTDYSAVIDEGPTLCNPTDPQTTTGSWGFASQEKQLILTKQVTSTVSFSLAFDMLELSATTMRLRYTDTSYTPYVSTRDVTFTAF